MPKLWRMSIIDPFEYTHDLGDVKEFLATSRASFLL